MKVARRVGVKIVSAHSHVFVRNLLTCIYAVSSGLGFVSAS